MKKIGLLAGILLLFLAMGITKSDGLYAADGAR